MAEIPLILLSGICTYDAIAKKGEIYIDGILKNAATSTVELTTDPASLVFGAQNSNADAPFVGLLDDVRIWSYPLNLAEILLLYVDFNPGSEVCVRYPEFDVAGPGGRGSEYKDCKVDIYDLEYIASKWLECNIIPTCQS